ncbi:MAG: asparagine synthase (glutamine-hydrolyzing) [Candidatus Aenigmarchaeota archaeon]|nr:asparagine synthase (glutamine-hydrolyzing) [Candidatus Aenigmarchaeota archaeon]
MCGICGFNWEDKGLIKKCTDTLSHRGPDDKGYYTDELVSLGHRRLSIIDLSEKGRQPMPNEDETVWIVFNGEIYNYKALAKILEEKGHRFFSNTDTEVIIHAYEEWGKDCLKLFNGMFAFCIYDRNKNLFFIARDRIGIKPLYYTFYNGNFVFASEMKAILKAEIFKPQINFDSLNKFLMLRYIPGNESIFRYIRKLLPSHYMIFDLKSRHLSSKRYWNLKEYIVKKREKEYIKELKNLLMESVSLRLVSDVPLGAYLSGGIDSAVVVGAMRKLNPDGEIRTFSVGFEQGDKFNELDHAKYVSDFFETNHKEFIIGADAAKLLPSIIWHLDEPIADPAIVPTFLLSKHAKKYVTVVLTGDGGDEMFAGYDQYKFLDFGNRIRRLPLKEKIPRLAKLLPATYLDRIYKYSSSTGDRIFDRAGKFLKSIDNNNAGAYLEVLSIFDEAERLRILDGKAIEKIGDFNCYEKFNREFFNKNFSFLNKILYFDINNVLPEDFLMKVDKMTMANAVEGRVPLLDFRIAEFSFSLPPQLKLHNFTTKYILKKTAREFIPARILKRKKQTFHMPIDVWLEKDLKPILESLLSKDDIKNQGYFNNNEIEKIFKNYRSSPLFYGRQLWSLLNFEIWHKIFIEEENVKKILL